jgi:HEAT repeat protein
MGLGGVQAMELIEKALEDEHEDVRVAAVKHLGGLGGEKALNLLEKTLEDKAIEVRGEALSALGQLGGDKAQELLEKTLASPDAGLRWHAMEALTRVDVRGEKAVRLLEKALEDPTVKVREFAAYRLGNVGGDKARDRLLKKLTEEKDEDVRTAIRKSLAVNFDGDPAVEKAVKGLKPADVWMR